VTICFLGGEIEEATWHKEPCTPYRWFRRPSGIQIEIADETTSGRTLTHLVNQEKKVLALILNLTTRVLRVIRNVANVPAVPETVPRDQNIRKALRGYRAESSVDGQTWVPLVPPPAVEERIGFGFLGEHYTPLEGFDGSPWVWMDNWCRIAEVLEEGREVSPEDEFLTNTFGHLHAKNLRLALVEAVIGLEIVLSGYLKTHLDVLESVPPHRINHFLRTDMGLTARLSAILDLCLHDSYVNDLPIDAALKAVKWRNGIMHETGRLPNVPEETIEESINAVVKIARTLAERRDDVLATPFKRKLADTLSTSGHIFRPSIWMEPWHKVAIEITFLHSPPSRAEMEVLVLKTIEELKARDRRFESDRHLRIHFKALDGTAAGIYGYGLLKLPSSAPAPQSST
jgi:hypothetical protein